MRIGLIGAGSMGGALGRGIGEPMLVADVDRRRAEELAAEIGGEALESNADVAARADVVLLAHKPAQLEQVARSLGDGGFAVASILGGTSLATLEGVYPERPVYRFMPNIPAEVRRGFFCFAAGTLGDSGPERELLELFGRAGTVLPLDEALFEPATAVMSCAPAFFALVVEGLVDAGVRHGLAPADAARMAVETMAGTAAVLEAGNRDTAALRRRVTSPGGLTARGLAALERGGVRSALSDAVDAVVGAARR